MDTYLEKMERLVEKVEDWSTLPPAPTVSVWMITYNHEAFIGQALDGILMQVTSFPFEVVIGEDKSTDRTRAIVQEYQQRHPDRIRLRLAKENLHSQGMKPLASVLSACRGRYVAMCEGDDYWTDPYKLQKQVDFLESHHDYAICFHRSCWLEQATGKIEYWKPWIRRHTYTYTLDDLVRGDFIPTASIMFRNGLVPEFPAWFYDVPVGDWPLLVLLAQHGDAGFIDQLMSVTRIHGGGMWWGSSPSKHRQMVMKTFAQLRTHLGPGYEKLIKAGVSDRYLDWAVESANLGDLASARAYLRAGIVKCPLVPNMRIMEKLILLGRVYTPPIYWAAKRLQTSLSSRFQA